MKFVVDASVLIRDYLKEPYHERAHKVIATLLDYPGLFAVPELISYEVFSVLYRCTPYASEIFELEVNRILHSGILRYPMTENIFRRADRFVKLGLTGYDASYAAMAEELGGFWLTFDKKAHILLKDEKVSVDLTEGLPEGWEEKSI